MLFLFYAAELCPELIFVPPNFAKYKKASRQTRFFLCLFLSLFIHFKVAVAIFLLLFQVKSNLMESRVFHLIERFLLNTIHILKVGHLMKQH